MANHNAMEVADVMLKVAKVCPHLWRSFTINTDAPQLGQSPSGEPNTLPDRPSWCKCGKCHEEEDPEDRLCCKNHAKNHESPIFEMVVLDEHTVEVALTPTG